MNTSTLSLLPLPLENGSGPLVFTVIAVTVGVGLIAGVCLIIRGLRRAKRAARASHVSQAVAAGALHLKLGLLITGISFMVPTLLGILSFHTHGVLK